MHTRRVLVILLVVVLVGAGTLSTFSAPLIAAESAASPEGSSEWVNSVFQDGKSAYYAGDYPGALAQWDRLTPYLSQPSNASVRRMVDFLKSRIKDQLPAAAEVAAPAAAAPPQAPVGLRETLSSAVDRLDEEASALEGSRRAAAESSKESQARVDAIFQRGRLLYEQGRIPEAVSVWRTLTPLVANGESLASSLDALDQKYREYENVRKNAERADSADPSERAVAPRELMSVLNATNEKLRQDTLEAQQKLAENDREISKQQVWLLQTFQRGEDLYDQGRYDEAEKEWDSITPYLRGQDEAEQLYLALRENFRNAIEARQNADNAAAGKQVKFKAPAEFLTLLNQADRKLKAEAEEAALRKNDVEAQTADKERQLRTLYEKGKFLFEDGQYKEALEVWEQMAPNFADEVQIRTSLRFIDSNYAKWLDAQESAKKASVQKDAKIEAPADLRQVLDNASMRLEQEVRAAEAQRTGSERSLSERRAQLNAEYQKGRSLFEAGRIDDAIRAWEGMLPYVENADELGRQLSALRQNSARAETEKRTAAELTQKVNAKTQAPDEMVRLLSQAGQDLESAADKAQNERQKMEKTVFDRQAWIRSTFDEAKLAYQKGEVDEALRLWDKLEPYLDETQGLRELIARVRQANARAVAARRETDGYAATEYKNLKLPFADEMDSFLTRADQDLRSQTDRAVAERRDMEKTVAERQAMITDTFEKGRSQYQSGDIERALETWDSITPYLRDGSRIKVFIEQIRQNSLAAADAKTASDEAAKKKDMKFESPEGLARLLDSVSQKYLEQKQLSMTQQADAEKAADDRRAWLATTFAKGKTAYQQGDLKAATNIWREMLPYLENESDIRESLLRLEEEARAAEAAKADAEALAAKKDQRLQAPGELAAILGQATAKLESDVRIAADQRAQAEATALQRQSWIRSTFETGRKLYEDGKFKEALDIWKEIVPYVDEASGLRQSIAAAQSAVQSHAEAMAALETAQQESSAKFRANDELAGMLSEMKTKMVGETAAAETEHQKARDGYAERQRLVSDSFEKGRALYERGNYAEAIRYWEMIPQHVENGAQMRETLSGLRLASERLEAARAEAQNASEQERAMLTPPKELGAMLGSVDEKLKAETQEANVQRSKAEQSLSDRQQQVNAIFAKGKALASEGRYTEAVAEWEKLSNYFDDGSGVPKLIAAVSEELKVAQAAKRSAVEAAANEYKLIQAPSELDSMVSAASAKLVAEAQAARAAQVRSEKSLMDRQTWLNDTFAKAVDMQKQGNYEGALKLWAQMMPYLKESPEAQQAILTLKENYDAFIAAKNAAEQAGAALHQRPKVPGDLVMTLTEANERLKNDTAIASQRTVDASRTLAERQAYVEDVLKKARQLYEGGKVREALDTWRTALPYFEDDKGELKTALNQVDIALGNAEDAKRARDQALEKESAKLPVSEPFRALVNQARRSLDDETRAALDQKAKSEMTRAEREKWVADTIAQGQRLAEQGHLADAIDAWDSVTPQLEGEAAWKKIIAQLRENYQATVRAQQGAQQSTAAASAKLPAPDGFNKQLGLAQQQMDFTVQDAQARKQKMEKDIAERKALVLDHFKKGSAFFQKHQYPEAFAEWDKMMPYLDPEQGVLQMLDKVKQTYEKSEESWRLTNEFAQHEYKDLRVPFAGEMKQMLEDVDQTLALKIQDSEQKRSEMQKTFAERQEWIGQTFEKGKEQLAAARYSEAIDTWNTLLPYLEDDSKVKQAIADFNQTREKLQAAENARAEAESRKDVKFNTPEPLFKMLEETGEALKQKAFESKNQVAQIDKNNADRERDMFAQFQKGRTLFEQGQYPEAVETWKALEPYLADKTQLAAAVKNFEENRALQLEAETQAQQALSRKDAKMRAPEELLAMLARASENLKSEASQSRSEALLTEKSNADRQQFVLANFNKGKELYDQGKFKEATEVWDEILPYLDDEAMLRDSVKNVQETYESLVEAKQQAAHATVQQDMKFETPEELPKLLIDVQQRFKLDGMKALGDTAQAEKSRSEREEWLRATFMKGKQLFNDGRYAEAIETWRAMTAYLENPQKIEQMLGELEEGYKSTLEAKKTAQDALAKQDRKFQTPSDLVQYLREADEVLKNEAYVAQTQRSRTEQSFSDKQQFINQTYLAGKSYYQEGKYGQAVSEWSKLGPYLDEASGLPKLLEMVKKSYEASLEAKKSAVEAAAGEYKGLQLSYKDQMSKLLDEANAKLIRETSEARLKQTQTETTLAERKEWAVTTFNKGKILYDQGRFDEALEQWERLVPFVGEDSFLAKQIETMRKNYNVSLEAKQAAESVTSGKPVPADFKEGSQLSLELEQMSLKFKDEADKYRDKAAEHDKSVAERKEWMSFVYKKGKDFYEQGKYDDALAQWELLSPYLSEQPDLARMIDRAKAMATQKKNAESLASESRAKAESLTPLPSGAETDLAAMTEPKSPVTPQASMPSMPSSGALPLTPKAEPAAAPAEGSDTIEFVSGEVTTVDDIQKTITLKPYTAGKAETVTVAFDEGTQVSSTESNQSLSTLQRGSAIDIRYDLKTSRAVYVYIY